MFLFFILGPLNSFTKTFLGFAIYVSNSTQKSEWKMCFKDTNYNASTIPAVVNITCRMHGRFVIYYNERLPGSIYPKDYSEFAFNELCEVEVYGR